MRVAIVVSTFPQVSETFIANKVIGLVDRGCDVHVVCRSSPAANWERFGPTHRIHELRDRVHVSPLPGSGVRSARTVTGLAAQARRASRSSLARYWGERPRRGPRGVVQMALDVPLIELQPDVVHFEFGALAPDRMSLRDQLGCAVTVSFRGYDLNYSHLDDPDYYRPVWESADRVHVLGDDLWRRAIRRGASLSVPHQVITPAIDTSAVHSASPRPGPIGTEADPLRLLSVGRLHWKKGYDVALDAVALLVSRGITVEYRIIGDGDLRPAVAYWRRQLGLESCVDMLLGVPPDVVAEQLRWADILAHCATSEGFCNAVIEAQAHQVPVVCTDADGLPENVDDGVTGIVVPRRDPVAVADAVEALARDEERRARMGRLGRQRVERRFRMEDQIDAWMDFYRAAIARHRQGPEPLRSR